VKNSSGLYVTADKVLVEPNKVEEKSAGGIVIPAQSLEKEELAQITGKVIAMGQTCPLCPEMEGIEVGDTVLYARYSGAEFPVNGVRYRIIRARDILGKSEGRLDSVLRGAQSSAQTFGVNETVAAE